MKPRCALVIVVAFLVVLPSARAVRPAVEAVDALSGGPIPNATRIVASGGNSVIGHPGYWPVLVPADAAGPAYLVPRAIEDRPAAGAFCAPLAERPEDPIRPQMIPPLAMPPTLPDTIRVGRRMAATCSGNPVQRIDTIGFEDYVKGVVYAEIGVFQSVAGGPASAAESFKTFAIAARSYALYKYLVDPGAQYHIDDTACNQRYLDQRAPPINDAVDAVRAMIMVKAADHHVIDAYEYAASCGRHGSRPAYQTAIVPDVTGQHACVGSWCGHDTCAGHEDNPDLPGTDKCLVRGICQWGSVERSMGGQTYDQIVDQYQSNLDIITLPYGGGADGGTDAGTGTADAGDTDARDASAQADVSHPLDAGAPDAGKNDGGGPSDAGGPKDAGTAPDVNPCGPGTRLEGGVCVVDDGGSESAGGAKAGESSATPEGSGGGCSCAVLAVH